MGDCVSGLVRRMTGTSDHWGWRSMASKIEPSPGSFTTASVKTTAPTAACICAASDCAFATTSQSSPASFSSVQVTSPSRRVGGSTNTLRSRASKTRAAISSPFLGVAPTVDPRRFDRHAGQNTAQLQQGRAQMNAVTVEGQLAYGFFVRPGAFLQNRYRLLDLAGVLEEAQHHDRVRQVAGIHRRLHGRTHEAALCDDHECGD